MDSSAKTGWTRLGSTVLVVTTITSAGWTRTSAPRTPSGAGSTPGTTAGSAAWTSCPSRPSRSTTTSRDSLILAYHTSGPPAVSVTSMVATGPTCFPRTSTAGSGLQTRSLCHLPTAPGSTIGHPLAGFDHLADSPTK